MWKTARRILAAILILILALLGLLAGSVIVDGLGAGARLEAVTNTRLPGVGGPDVRAYVARPATPGPHPAVILIHEFWGLNESITEKADLLAEAGYFVVAPDVFRGSATGYIPRAIYQVVSTPAEQVNADLDTVFAWLAAQPDVAGRRVAIAGFCFGGRASLLYSLHNNRLAGTVIFYGGPVTDVERLRALPGPVLGIFGGADNSIPLDEVRAFEAGLEQAGVPHQITVYDGQPHAFVSSVEGIKAGGAQGRAWDEMLTFLQATLKDDDAVRRDVSPVRAGDVFGWAAALRLAFSHLDHLR